MPFEKGVVHKHKSTGRPKGFRGVAKQIQKRTLNGKALVDFAMEIFEDADGKYFWHQRWAALMWLSDRGFGKPMLTIELDAAITTETSVQPKIDLSKLTATQRQGLREILTRALGRPRDVGHTATGAPLQLVDGGGDDE